MVRKLVHDLCMVVGTSMAACRTCSFRANPQVWASRACRVVRGCRRVAQGGRFRPRTKLSAMGNRPMIVHIDETWSHNLRAHIDHAYSPIGDRWCDPRNSFATDGNV